MSAVVISTTFESRSTSSYIRIHETLFLALPNENDEKGVIDRVLCVQDTPRIHDAIFIVKRQRVCVAKRVTIEPFANENKSLYKEYV